MWTKGKINGYEYTVKHYEEGSIYGIDEGRISKLEIRKNGQVVASYERGWEIRPANKEAEAILNQICKKYN